MFAGPGPDYWRGQKNGALAADSNTVSQPCAMTCADSKTVTVTERRNAWHNGRGSLETVVVGDEANLRIVPQHHDGDEAEPAEWTRADDRMTLQWSNETLWGAAIISIVVVSWFLYRFLAPKHL